MKNCPQCNDTPEVIEKSGGFEICCPFCGLSTKNLVTEWDATQAWDEIVEVLNMRMDLLAINLSQATDEQVKKFLRYNSLMMVNQFLQRHNQLESSWVDIKSSIGRQFKIVEYMYDKLKKRIADFRSSSVGE